MKLDHIPKDPEIRKHLTPEQRVEIEELIKNLHTEEIHERFQKEYECEFIDSEEDSDET